MPINRIDPDARMSDAVVHGGTVYLGGQVAERTKGQPVREQTREILGNIDRLLAQAGSDKTKLLTVSIFLADIRTITEMNEAWDEWIDPSATPARATIEAKLATTEYAVEITATAAV